MRSGGAFKLVHSDAMNYKQLVANKAFHVLQYSKYSKYSNRCLNNTSKTDQLAFASHVSICSVTCLFAINVLLQEHFRMSKGKKNLKF